MEAFIKFILSVLPWALLFTLPYFLTYMLGKKMIWKGERDRCRDCERKSEELRSRLARAKQEYRELEQEIDDKLSAS